MIKDVKIKKLERFSDQRGWLIEAYRKDDTKFRPVMAYISETLPGQMRGPHEHEKQSDNFIFLFGNFRLYLWDNRKGSENYRKLETVEVGEINPVSVIIPPGVVHGYKCISKEPGLVLNLPNKLYKGKGKKKEVDEIRWEAMKDSPFKAE